MMLSDVLDWRLEAFFDDLTTEEIELFIGAANDALVRRLLEEDEPPAKVLQFPLP